jgi:methanogenic corrinoid protein MtbC1
MADSNPARLLSPVTFTPRDPMIDAFRAIDEYAGPWTRLGVPPGPVPGPLTGSLPGPVGGSVGGSVGGPVVGQISGQVSGQVSGTGAPPLSPDLPPFLGDTSRADAFCTALLDDDMGLVRRLLLPGLDRGWSPDMLAEDVVPAAAARLGQWWIESRASFAEVAVGCARLHEILRVLREQADREPLAPHGEGDVLLVTPETDHHSLAASILAYRFRRLGVGVRLVAGMSPRQVVPLLQGRAYGAVAISVGCRQSLLQSRALIAMIRSAVTRPVPVVIGGPVLGLDMEMVRKTGADFATNDIEAALDFCDISPISGEDVR